jgi:nucleotide-binding universal stress UspA family protein
MYKHILLPTDGSPVAERAAGAGITLAAAIGARVTALHVLPRPAGLALESWGHPGADCARRREDALLRRGGEYLAQVREAARYAGVECECSLERAPSVHGAIVDVARASGCDLIVMGSNVKDDAAAILGSEAVRALANANIAILVQPPRSRPGSSIESTGSIRVVRQQERKARTAR